MGIAEQRALQRQIFLEFSAKALCRHTQRRPASLHQCPHARIAYPERHRHADHAFIADNPDVETNHKINGARLHEAFQANMTALRHSTKNRVNIFACMCADAQSVRGLKKREKTARRAALLPQRMSDSNSSPIGLKCTLELDYEATERDRIEAKRPGDGPTLSRDCPEALFTRSRCDPR